MTVYLVDPDSFGGGAVAAELFRELMLRLQQFTTVTHLTAENSLWEASPGSADALVIANSVDDDPPEALVALVRKAVSGGAVPIPVAGDKTRRRPMTALEASQSFDVRDRLRQRSQPETAIPVIADELARSILSRVQPTLTKDQLRLFLCHRRPDGEDLTSLVDAALSKRHIGNVFRDLVSIQVGEVAQEKIEAELERADLVVFLDTPLAGESTWVEAELRAALGRQTPIVWVRIGMEADRPLLFVRPAGTPHLAHKSSDMTAGEADALADQIMAVAADLAVENIRRAHQTFFRVGEAARGRGMNVVALDQKRLIYSLTDKADDNEPYPRRPQSDVVQVFGRHPNSDDVAGLTNWLEENDYGPHSNACRAYDAAVLLDPLTRELAIDVDNNMVITYSRDYLARLEPTIDPPVTAPRLLLLGAFPDEPGSQEPVKQAVYTIARGWLANGGLLTFGGHPTFTPMILEVRSRLGLVDVNAVTIYQSKFYVSQAMASTLSGSANVVLTEDTGERDTSLTAMRGRMLADDVPDVVLAIGGRTGTGGHVPGLDEEIAFAREAGVDPILLGGPGGWAAQLAQEAGENSWTGLDSRFDLTQHAWFAETDDYEEVLRVLWNGSIGSA